MKRIIILTVLTGLLFITKALIAQEDGDKQFYQAGLSVYYPFSTNVTNQMGPGIDLKMGYEYLLIPKLKIGGNLGIGAFDAKNPSWKAMITYLPLNFNAVYSLWNINENSRIEIIAGPSYHTTFGMGKYRLSSLGAHGGLRYCMKLSAMRELQLELSGHEWVEEMVWTGSTDLIEISAVISSPGIKTIFSKGVKPEPAKVVEFEKEPVKEVSMEKDSDGDGVPDLYDKSPGTPPGVSVDSYGRPFDDDMDGIPDYIDLGKNTPLGVDIDSRGRPLDSDNDKVPDYRDCHPGTPEGVKVDKMGVPLDSDGDGVPDYLDKELNTPKYFIVDKDGIGLWGVKEGIMTGVKFEGEKAVLSGGSYEALFNLFLMMYVKSNIKLEITGYSEDIGNAAEAMKRSVERGEAIRDYLAGLGIEAKRITVTGKGAVDFINSNSKSLDNRRIEIRMGE